mgnify:FL=1
MKGLRKVNCSQRMKPIWWKASEQKTFLPTPEKQLMKLPYLACDKSYRVGSNTNVGGTAVFPSLSFRDVFLYIGRLETDENKKNIIRRSAVYVKG